MGLHKKILGGEQYLPFALSKLRGLVNDSAQRGGVVTSRTITADDGTLIMLKVAGTEQFVTIIAPPLFMDSGIAAPDIFRPAPMDVLGLAEVRFLKLESQLYYDTKIRATLPDKKLLGAIQPPSLSCTPSVEGEVTRAFKMQRDEHDVPLEASKALGGLKKICAMTVPPSMFTGKLRLYFQAQYGGALAKWKFTLNPSNLPTLDYIDANNVPLSFGAVNTGLYTDSKHRHWLLQLVNNKVTIYKMRAGAAAEELRRSLVMGLTTLEHDRIEAYILADSYPDIASVVYKPVSVPITFSMGYGWHFNWSGNRTDIVRTDLIELHPGQFEGPRFHRSTHLHISFTRDDALVDDPQLSSAANEERRWTVVQQAEQPVDWKNKRDTEVLASPAWDPYPQLEIFGDRSHEVWFGSNAPVYCFYNRDKLQVVLYNTTGFATEGASYEVISTPSYYGGNVARNTRGEISECFGNSALTVGLDSGRSEARTYSSNDIVSAYSIAGAAVSTIYRNYNYTRFAVDKVLDNPTWGSTVYQHLSPSQATNYFNGRDTVNTGGLHGCSTTVTAPPTTQVNGPMDAYLQIGLGTATLVDATGTHAESGEMACVIPYGDAEAVYFWGQQQIGVTESGSISVGASDPTQQTPFILGIHAVPGGDFFYAEYTDAPNHTVTGSSYSTAQTDWNITCSKLLSNAGVLDFESRATTDQRESSMHDFFVSADYVAMAFWTRTSALESATQGQGVKLTDGYIPALQDKPYVFIGWA